MEKNKRDYIECEIHGKSPIVKFEINYQNYEKVVCFRCWVDKTTQGLKIFAKEEIKSE